MINNVEFSERLKKIIDFYDETASSFAEKIGVQRSSISHILSGRNKPSLDFVMKILSLYPEVDLYWLMNGKGNFPKTELKSSLHINQSISEFTPSSPTSIDSNKTTPHPSENNSSIERIVIFYKDGTFKNYKP